MSKSKKKLKRCKQALAQKTEEAQALKAQVTILKAKVSSLRMKLDKANKTILRVNQELGPAELYQGGQKKGSLVNLLCVLQEGTNNHYGRLSAEEFKEALER